MRVQRVALFCDDGLLQVCSQADALGDGGAEVEAGVGLFPGLPPGLLDNLDFLHRLVDHLQPLPQLLRPFQVVGVQSALQR